MQDDADSGYHTGGSTLRAVAAAARSVVTPPLATAPVAETRDELREKIQAFNNNNHGLVMTLVSAVCTSAGLQQQQPRPGDDPSECSVY